MGRKEHPQRKTRNYKLMQNDHKDDKKKMQTPNDFIIKSLKEVQNEQKLKKTPKGTKSTTSRSKTTTETNKKKKTTTTTT